MNACPEAALPVVEKLRAEVPRPEYDRLYPSISGKTCTRFAVVVEDQECHDWCCPIGLLPYCRERRLTAPSPEVHQFPGLSYAAASAFIEWWDYLPEEQIEEAMDFIWPEKASA